MSKKNQYKSIKIAASAALVASVLVPVAAVSADFTDVKTGDQFKKEIDYLASRGVVKGYTNGTFLPNKDFSRAEIVYLIGQYLESLGETMPADATTNFRFKDTTSKTDKRFLGYAALLYDNGIFEGRANGTLDGNATITREESAKVMVSFLSHYFDTDIVAFAKSRSTYNATAIRDLNVASDWAKDYILALKELNITLNTVFSPKAKTKRGEYAAFVYRSLVDIIDNSTINREVEQFKNNQPGAINLGSVVASQNGARLNVSGAKSGQKYEVWEASTKLGEATVNTSGRASITVNPAVRTGVVYTIKVSEGTNSKTFTKTFSNLNENEDPNVLAALESLRALVNSTSTLQQNDYTTSSWSALTAVLEECRIMLENPTYVLADITKLTTDLQNAINGLVTKVDLAAIKEQLRVLIVKIGNLDRSILTPEGNAQLTAGLNSGSALLNGPDQPYQTYKDKITELELLISNLNLTANKVALINLINDAETLKAADYTTETFGPFATKLAAAKAVLADLEATQAQVDTAVTELTAARSALIYKELTIPAQVKGIEIKASEINTSPKTIGGVINSSTPNITFSTIDLGLGQLADASVLAAANENNAFTVPANGVLSFDVRLTNSSVLSAGQITLYVLKKQGNGQYKNVWEEEINFFSLLGIPLQNKYNLSVTDLDSGEYIISAYKSSGINLSVLGGNAIVFSNPVLLDSSPNVNTETAAVVTGVSGTLTSSVNSSGVELLSVKEKSTAGTPAFTSNVNGKYGKLTVNKLTGAYTYKSNGDPKSIGKVDVFEYRLKNTIGQTEVGNLYIRTNPIGTTLNWNQQNLEQSVSLATVANKQTQSVIISRTGVIPTISNPSSYTRSISIFTNPLPVILTDFVEVSHPNDVIAFDRIKSGGTDREIKYEILNEAGTVVGTKVFDFNTLGSVAPTYVTGLAKGKYKVQVTVLEQDSYTFGLNNLRLLRNEYSSSTVNGDFSVGNGYVYPGSLLYVGSSYVATDGFKVEGEYGILTVNKNGVYSYSAYTNASTITGFEGKAFADENAFGKYEVFEFKYVAPNGDESTATLRINITGTATPQTPSGDLIPLVSSSSASGEATGTLAYSKVKTTKYGSTITLG